MTGAQFGSFILALVVIAIVALTASLVLPNIRAMMKGNEARTAAFLFQNRLTELRGQAYREQLPVLIANAGQAAADPEADPPEEITLDPGWTYRLSEPVEISSGGVCSAATVELFRDDALADRRRIDSDCGVRREEGV